MRPLYSPLVFVRSTNRLTGLNFERPLRLMRVACCVGEGLAPPPRNGLSWGESNLSSCWTLITVLWLFVRYCMPKGTLLTAKEVDRPPNGLSSSWAPSLDSDLLPSWCLLYSRLCSLSKLVGSYGLRKGVSSTITSWTSGWPEQLRAS